MVDEAKEGATRLPDFRKMMRTIDEEEGRPQTSEDTSAVQLTRSPSHTMHADVRLACHCLRVARSAATRHTQQGAQAREWEQGEEEILGDCWKCGKGHVVSRPQSNRWSCSLEGCDFVIWKTTASREMQKV
jgi:hypothetical protein